MVREDFSIASWEKKINPTLSPVTQIRIKLLRLKETGSKWSRSFHRNKKTG